MSTVQNVILYRGPSMLDGKPIIVIATGLDKARKSSNGKTGAMVQTWIMREDISPKDAVNSGNDASVCGDCMHRGVVVNGKNKGRSCYVTIWQAPRNVWQSYHRGIYSAQWDSNTFAGLLVRLGSYGDPAAVPFWVWEKALAQSAGHTGYTHQWRRAPELAAYCMASCDSEGDRVQAKFLGFRTFRVRPLDEPSLPREVTCGASKEMGYRTACDKCKACGGTSAKAKADIVISVHGAKALQNNYMARAA
jgi:hypothetical protein